jgi:Flp pilus assembly protein TadD
MRTGQAIWRTIIFSVLPAAMTPQADRDVAAGAASAVAGKDFDKALELLQPALQKFPQDAKLWTLERLALAGKGQTKKALAAYETALKSLPEFLSALEGERRSYGAILS